MSVDHGFPVGRRVIWRTASAQIIGTVVGHTRMMVKVRWSGDLVDSRLYPTSLEPLYSDIPSADLDVLRRELRADEVPAVDPHVPVSPLDALEVWP